MTIMPFEGLMSVTHEEEFGLGIVLEPTHSDEDETYYSDYILTGLHDDEEQDHGDWSEETYDPDGWMDAQDAFEAAYFGE